MFFWFFESRSNPSTDPVVLWLSGGPGCSSLSALFYELGPASIGSDMSVNHNPYSWTNNASVIFVDQPVNTGLSYSDDGTEPTNSVLAERDVYSLLQLFFLKFPQYAQREFFIAGESYGGHFVSALGVEIWTHKDRAFNLSGILIGNGLTDPAVQYTSYTDMACGRGGYPAVVDNASCQAMADATPKCVNFIEKCYADQSSWACAASDAYCTNALFLPYLNTGYNIYDIRENCQVDRCDPGEKDSDYYLNQTSVKEALGAPAELSFVSCSDKINNEFTGGGDWMRPYKSNVTELLNNDVRVLIYAGDTDFIVNWIGNDRWTRVLEWKNGAEFHNQPLVPWTVDGKELGQVRTYGKLTFARIHGGGHLLPHDQPKSSMEMFNTFITNTSFT